MRVILISVVLLLVGLAFWINWASSDTVDPAYHERVEVYEKREWKYATDTLSAMTYNIGYLSGMANNDYQPNEAVFEENLDKVISVITEIKPDFIGFQEIDYVANRSFYQNQLDSIAIKAKYWSAYASINWDKRYVPFPYWPPSDHFQNIVSGQAILSDYAIMRVRGEVLQKAPMAYPLNQFYLDRLVQIADLQVGKYVVKIMNVHLEAFDQKTRIAQAKEVKRIYESFADRRPVILMGDFNSELEGENSKTIDIILSGKDIKAAVDFEKYSTDSENFNTYSSTNPEYMIDHIFYNENWITPVSARVVKEMGEISDHLPVYFEFTITGTSPYLKAF